MFMIFIDGVLDVEAWMESLDNSNILQLLAKPDPISNDKFKIHKVIFFKDYKV